MDVLSYIQDILPEIKLIILSKFDTDLLKEIDVSQDISEIIFKYRYKEYYVEIKNIIKVNRSLKFSKYTEEGPYFWKILLNDKLQLEKNHKGDRFFIDINNSWKYYDIISTDIEIMVLFYRIFSKYYEYINKVLEDKYGLYLLGNSFNYTLHGHIYNSDIISKMLITGKIERIEVDDDEYSDMMGSDEAFDLIIRSYFLKQFVPKNKLVIPIASMEHYLEVMSQPSTDFGFDYVFYENFGHILDKYMIELKA